MVLLIDDDQRVRTVRINRPAALNAMDNATFAAIRDALAAAEQDPAVAVVVLTGTGRAFCAGQDLTEMLATRGEDAEPHQFPSMIEMVTSFRKPLIAAVNGLGVGIGMTILAHCDLVLMASTARLRTPFPQLGLAPEAGSSWTFASRVGWQHAASILLSGRWFDAEECLRMGFVWKVCEPDELERETMAVAREWAANPIPSLIATKELMLAAGRREEAIAAHRRELLAYDDLIGAPANREAVAAFLDKREPDFSSIPGL
ncbi:MAG: enoyl-CoA hydratase/isomerase family protein [Acidimicrobiia bacterium]